MEALEAAAAIRQELSCPLCHKTMSNPQTFNTPMCGHTFCKDCVVATLEGPGIVKSQCPVCKQPAWKRDLHTNHKYTAIAEATAHLEAVLRMQGLDFGLFDGLHGSLEDAAGAGQAASSSPQEQPRSLHYAAEQKMADDAAAGAAETAEHDAKPRLPASPAVDGGSGGPASQPDPKPSTHRHKPAAPAEVSNAGSDDPSQQHPTAATVIGQNEQSAAPVTSLVLVADVQQVMPVAPLAANVSQGHAEREQQGVVSRSQEQNHFCGQRAASPAADTAQEQQLQHGSNVVSHLQQQQPPLSDVEQLPGRAYWQFQKLLADMLNSAILSLQEECQPLQLPDSFVRQVSQLPSPGTADVLKLQQDLNCVEAMLEDLDVKLQDSCCHHDPVQQHQQVAQRSNTLCSPAAADSTKAPNEAAAEQPEQQLQHQQHQSDKLAQDSCMPAADTSHQAAGSSRRKRSRASGCSRGSRGFSSHGAGFNLFAGLSGPSGACSGAAKFSNCSGPLVGQTGRPSLERAFADVMAAAAHAADLEVAHHAAATDEAAAVTRTQKDNGRGQHATAAVLNVAARSEEKHQQLGQKSGKGAVSAPSSKDRGNRGSGVSRRESKKTRTARSTASAAGSEECLLDAQCRRSSRKRTTVMKAPSQINQAQSRANEVVGLRIQIFWDGDGRYYSGTITKYNSRSKLHTIVYDDGEVDTRIDLDKECWMLASESDNLVLHEGTAVHQQQRQQDNEQLKREQQQQQLKHHHHQQQLQQGPDSSARVPRTEQPAQQQQQQQGTDLHYLKKQLLQAKGFVIGRKQLQQRPAVGAAKRHPGAAAVHCRQRQQHRDDEALSNSSSSLCGSDATSGDDSIYDAEAEDASSDDDFERHNAAASGGGSRHQAVMLEQACSSDLEVAAAASDTDASDGYFKQQRQQRKRKRPHSRRQQAAAGKAKQQRRRCVSEPPTDAVWRTKQQQQQCRKRPSGLPVGWQQQQRQQSDTEPDLEGGSALLPAAAAAAKRRTTGSRGYTSDRYQRQESGLLVHQRHRDRHEQLLQQELEAAWANMSQQLGAGVESSSDDNAHSDDDAADVGNESDSPVKQEPEQQQASAIIQPLEQQGDKLQRTAVGAVQSVKQPNMRAAAANGPCVPVDSDTAQQHPAGMDGRYCDLLSDSMSGSSQERSSSFSDEHNENQQQVLQHVQKLAATAATGIKHMPSAARQQQSRGTINKQQMLADRVSMAAAEQVLAEPDLKVDNSAAGAPATAVDDGGAAKGAVKPVVVFVGMDPTVVREVRGQLLSLGAAVSTKVDNSKYTVCVVTPVDETGFAYSGPRGLYKALLLRLAVVGDHWLYDSMEQGQLLPVQDYLAQGFQTKGHRIAGGPARALQFKGSQRLFDGYAIIVAAIQPSKHQSDHQQGLSALAMIGGARTILQGPRFTDIFVIDKEDRHQPSDMAAATELCAGQKVLLISCDHHSADWATLQRQWPSADPVAANYILESIISCQLLAMDGYRVQA